jgi:flagellar basal-body rod protein FlgB
MDKFQIKRELFDHTIGLLQRSLDLRAFRHRILSDNIANSDNPNHTLKEVSFQKVLQETMQDRSPVLLRTTHPLHLSGELERAPEITASGEGVQLDQEMAKLAENNLLFQAGVQALLKKFEGLKRVIQEGGR